ncbi:MAG: hypothetical protein ABSG02_13675 [Terriglobales bacterium]
MSRMKSIFACLLLTAVVGIVPLAQATTVEVTIAGSSAMWQTMALGAYALAGAGGGHWTSASNAINLTDSRVNPVNVDAGTVWIVWNAGATKVWSFDKVDSVVGDRCYFAQPQCSVNGTSSALSGSGSNQISSSLWGDGSSDSTLPANVLSLFENGTPVNVAATDIRPEDANFAICRVNSLLGAGAFGGAASDGLDGLGYNSNWAAGVCPAGGSAAADYVGTPIKSGYPASTGQANVLSFNIKGKDPISGTTIPTFSVVEVGATPIVFITERASVLANLTNASEQQLQEAFSGTNCDASAFGLPAGGIGIFLREPLSGTYNTTEATVMRHPTVYGGAGPSKILGVSMESNVGANNPLAGQSGTCLNGAGARYRAIGTSEEVKSVQNSVKNLGLDGIGFTFFSYGNVGSIANNTSYGYITLDNIDPIFASYGPQSSTGAGYDPGQPDTAGTLPAAANLTNCSGAFPCPENQIWAGGLSFPNLRNGTYRAWSVVRLVSNGTGLTNAKTLVKSSQGFVVKDVPDYVPATKTTVTLSTGTFTDPGLELVRSHYQQYDGAGTLLGAAPVNCGTTEAGGDMGGIILTFVGGTKCPTTPTQQVQGNQGLQVRP